mmetsp:Transcript_6297/g.14214  ORF Transcript_6297/g.14214 Transcript_6297/m.14214 type:complete len:235 (+) Transcript_6297:922-1626(+)
MGTVSAGAGAGAGVSDDMASEEKEKEKEKEEEEKDNMIRFVVIGLLLLSCPIFGAEEHSDGAKEGRLLSACMGPQGEDPVHTVRRMVESGADINVKDNKSGQTPLMAAVLRGKVETVKYLLDKGADVTIGEANGYTLAHGAGFQGRADVMEVLHNHGIDVLNDRHHDGYLPFHRACWGREDRHTEVVKYLITAGIDVNVEGMNKDACIDMTYNPRTMEVLLENGSRERKSKEEL